MAKKAEVIISHRQHFHEFYREEYLKDANDKLNELHHADMHGVLGMENNVFTSELQTVTGRPKRVELNGVCEKCSITIDSAEKAYGNT